MVSPGLKALASLKQADATAFISPHSRCKESVSAALPWGFNPSDSGAEMEASPRGASFLAGSYHVGSLSHR